jgi:LPS-assembly protein
MDRAIPTISVDGQLFFERRVSFIGHRMLQTLEPRAMYVLTPYVNQDALPVFDTGYFDFTFLNMFRENRFAGSDRYGDANQLALALTSRNFSLDSGLELFRASLGQIFYFRDREVTLPPLSDDFINSIGLADAQFLYPGYFENNSSTSEMLGEVSTHFTEDLSARVTLQWDPDASRTSKSAVSMRYAPEDGTVVNLAYRQRQALTDVEQTDISFRLPLTENLSMVGRWAYSLQSHQALEVVGGIEYESCCWGVRLLSRRYIRNVEGEFDNAIFMQAELKGLAGVGRAASSFLRRSIPGYEPFF